LFFWPIYGHHSWVKKTDSAARVAYLENEIKRHQNLYYNAQPEISDADFDLLWDELQSLDPQNPLFQKVGADQSDGFAKSSHLIPMGSQEKASDPESFLKWADKIRHPEFIVQYKLDGASLELQYQAGRFIKAVTRGNGEIGDDITQNAVKMRGVLPQVAKEFTGGVRGEVIMSHEVHDEYFADKANCRNAANGLMKRKDGSGSEYLMVLCYDARHLDQGDYFKDELDKVAWLKKQGFLTVEQTIVKDAEAVIAYRAAVMDKRESIPYDIDGLVVKGREIDLEDLARARPQKQIAFKFSLEEAISTLREIEWSESGATYTPIGIVDPVQLAGTTVKRANLCNPDMLRKLDLHIGSRIIMTKRGEIIPKIEGLVENPAGVRPIEQPSRCSCGAELVDEGTRLYCPNPECPKRTLHRLRKWLDTLGVKEFGDALLTRLFADGKLKNLADLYAIKAEELAEIDRMGEISAAKVLKNLHGKKSLKLSTFLAGLDIDGIGELIAERFVGAGYDTLEKLRAAQPLELAGIFGVGEITSTHFLEGLASLKDEIDELLSVSGIVIETGAAEGPLTGKSFCFTGELSSMKRAEAEELVKSLGGKAKASVTKDLSYLVTNEPEGNSSKNQKARELSIPVIGEQEFLALVGR
jgi:DNA ligase (NAD+)